MNRIEIYETLKKRYDDSEFKNLCTFLLEVDYDNLSGTNKSDKMRELILFLERRERLPELVNVLSPQTPVATPTVDFLQLAKKKIEKGELEEAISILSENLPKGGSLEMNILQISSQFYMNKNSEISELLSHQESNLQRSKISHNLLELINTVD